MSCILKILKKKQKTMQLYECSLSFTCTCVVACVNATIVSSYSVHLNSLPSSKVKFQHYQPFVFCCLYLLQLLQINIYFVTSTICLSISAIVAQGFKGQTFQI